MDQINQEFVPKLRGKRVGLITSNMSRGYGLASSLDMIRSIKAVKKLTLLSPEHGYFSDFQAGETVSSQYDHDLEVGIKSLYREPRNFNGNSRKKIDESMRVTDSKRDDSKFPSKELMEEFDVIIYDLQDVGCRVYTHIATLVYSMEMAHKSKVEYLVLDRTNPITGTNPEGPLLKRDLFSFIGALEIPIRHALTLGELALFFNKFSNKDRTDLDIVKMKDWHRTLWHDETGLPWIMPSPNMPTLDTAIIYPGTVLFEGTNVSEGRGTTRPFQVIGSPWINGLKLKERIKSLKPPGVQIMEMKFRPTFSKYAGEVCFGIYINIADRNSFKPFEFSIALIQEILDLYPDLTEFYSSYFDKVTGNSRIRKMLTSGYSAEEIIERFLDETNKYISKIEEIKMYD